MTTRSVLRRSDPVDTEAKTRPDPTDQELLRRFITRRDEAAFAGLVQRHSRTVWGVCRRILHQEQDAEDAFQAVFLILARKAGSIHKGAAVGSWLYGVAYRIATKARQSGARRQEREARTVPPNNTEPPPWSEASCRELQHLLDQELQRLSEKYRAPFVLCCLEGLSKAEAARELGWKLGSVSGRLAQARKLLQARLARRGVKLTAVLTVAALAQGAAAAAAPAALVQATAQAVAVPLSGTAALSPAALSLAEGLLHAMTVTKVKAGVCLLLAAATLTAGAGVAVRYLAPALELAPPAPQAAAVLDRDTFLPPPVPLEPPIDEQVLTLAFSPDGKKLVTAGARHTRPGQLKLWDADKGECLVTLKSMRGIRAAAYAPDGKTLATGHFGGALMLRDPGTGKEQAVENGHKTGINSLAYSPDGSLLASAGLDRKVKVWDAAGLKEKHVLTGHTKMVFSVAFFRDGKAVVTGGLDNTARVWDLTTGKEKFLLEGHQQAVEAVAVSPDDKLVATASWDGTVKLWDAATGREVGQLEGHDGGVYAVAFAPGDANVLASATSAGSVYLWGVKEGREPVLCQKHADAVWALAFSPDGKRLASGSSDKTAKLWDLADSREVATLEHGTATGGPVTALAQAPDGKTVAVATQDRVVRIRNARSGEVVRLLRGHADAVHCLAFAPDGQTLASGSADKTVKLWDPADGTEKASLPGHDGAVRALAFAPAVEGGAGWLLASAGDDGVVKLWADSSNKEKAKFTGPPGPVGALAFAPDGTLLAGGGADGVIRLWNPADAAAGPVALKGHEGAVRALAYAPDGTLASGGADGTVRVWEWDGHAQRHSLRQHQGEVLALAFAPGGRTLVSGGADASVVVWDPAAGKVRNPLPGHRQAVTALAVSPAGEHLLSGSLDATLLRWKAANISPPPITLQGNEGGTWFAVYSPGGDWLASGGHGGEVTVWTRSLAPARSPFHTRPGHFWDAAYAPDGRSVALARGQSVEVWDADSGTVRRVLPLKMLARSVAFSADGKYLAGSTGGWANPDLPFEAFLWDAATGEPLATLKGHKGVVFRVQFAPDGKTLATSCRDRIVRLWEVPSGKLRGILDGHTAPAKGMAFLPDGTLVTASWDKTIRFWDVNTLQELRAWKGEYSWGSLDVSPDGALLAVAEGSEGSWPDPDDSGPAPLSVWHVASGKKVLDLKGHQGRILGVAFTRDGRGLVSAGGRLGSHGEVAYWDLASGRLRAVHKTPGQWMENVASSPDGRRVLTAATNSLHFWDVDFLHPERTWEAHKHIVSCGLFVGSDVLATGSWDTTIGLWNVVTGERVAALRGHTVGGVRSLALLPDGKTLLSSAEDQAVKLWDLATATEKGSLQGHTSKVYSAAVSPDGKTLATGGGDSKVKDSAGELLLWDLETGKPVQTFPAIAGTVWSVAFSPDGKHLAAVDTGHVKVWDVKTSQLLVTLPTPYARYLAFSPDGKVLAAGDRRVRPLSPAGEGIIHVWKTDTWEEQAVLSGHENYIFTVAFAPDGRSLATASQDGTVKLWRDPAAASGDAGPVVARVAAPNPRVTQRIVAAHNLAANAPSAEDPGETTTPQAGLRIGAVLAILLSLGVALALALWRHRKRSQRTPETPAVARKPRTRPSAPPTNGREERVSARPLPPDSALISFACAGCGKKLRCKAVSAGRAIRCPECRTEVVVPGGLTTKDTKDTKDT